MKSLIICSGPKPQDVVTLCREHGFGIEIQNIIDQQCLSNEKIIAETFEIVRGIELKSMHGPSGDLCPGSSDEEVRALARKRFEQGWSVATRMEVSHIIFHHGYVPHTSWRSGWLKRWPNFWKDFLQGKNERIRIHIENHLDHEPSLISEAVALVGRTEIFDINLDIGHAHAISKVHPVKWIEELKGQIGYVHLHDNRGKEDEHMALGDGNAPLVEVMHALEQYAPDAIWAIEMASESVVQSLKWMNKHGFLPQMQ